jgi:hypothetical protein
MWPISSGTCGSSRSCPLRASSPSIACTRRNGAVRGTLWLTEDRCDGTLIRVRTGRVQVTDTVRNRRIILRSGQSYLARARR